VPIIIICVNISNNTRNNRHSNYSIIPDRNFLTRDYKRRSTPKTLRPGRHSDLSLGHPSQASIRKIATAKDLCLCPGAHAQFLLPVKCNPLQTDTQNCLLGYSRGTCTPMFIAALFTIAKLWK
jgi:hypothetical protein